jgi:hypothetical protein
MEVKKVKLSTLSEDSENVRLHGRKNIAAIRDSLERFGQVEPLVVQKSTSKVIGGNGRLKVMRELKWAECEVVEVDVDDEAASALSITLNRTGELASWDEEALTEILSKFVEEDSFEGLGFTEKEYQDLLDSHVPEGGDSEPKVTGITKPPEAEGKEPQRPITKPGDRWILGDHCTLVCPSCEEGNRVNPSELLVNHKKSRLSYAEELYPAACDAIMKRFYEETGIEPMLGDVPFREVEKERIKEVGTSGE